jgi:hypothetical protein
VNETEPPYVAGFAEEVTVVVVPMLPAVTVSGALPLLPLWMLSSGV